MVKISELFDLDRTLLKDYLTPFTYPWEALGGLKEAIAVLGATLGGEYAAVEVGVWVHKGARVCASALVLPPAVICDGAEVRHGAYLRGGVLVGKGCVVGNSTEIKNAVLFDGAALPHFNYVGDGIIGYCAHLGAGAITSNVRADKGLITVHGGKDYFTGRRKVGAFVGDRAEVGCNAVLNPGTVVGKNSIVYPLSCVRGAVPPDCIYKRGTSYPRN